MCVMPLPLQPAAWEGLLTCHRATLHHLIQEQLLLGPLLDALQAKVQAGKIAGAKAGVASFWQPCTCLLGSMPAMRAPSAMHDLQRSTAS
jgi:hypothetical protein